MDPYAAAWAAWAGAFVVVEGIALVATRGQRTISCTKSAGRGY